MDDIKIVKYQKNDYLKLRDFARAAFHQKYILSDKKFLDWQYPSTSHAYRQAGSGNNGGVLMLAKVGEEIVGFFGYKDFPYKVYGERKFVRAIMNLFSAEKYRLAGVGPKLVETVFDTKNYILSLSLNETSRKLYRRYRPAFQEVGNLNRFFAVLGQHKMMKGFIAPHLSPPPADEGRKKEIDGFLIEKIKQISGEFDEFWAKVRNRYSVTIERSSEYLNWRFVSHPFLDYQILAARQLGKLSGFLVYRFEEVKDFKIARVVDFVAEEYAEVSLLAEFLKRAKGAGAHAADFMFSGLLYRKSLAVAGFFDVSSTDFAKFPIRFNPISLNRFSINVAYDWGAPLRDCYLTKADTDQDRPNPH